MKLRKIVFEVEQIYIYQDLDDIDKRAIIFLWEKKIKPKVNLYIRVFEKDKDTDK